MAGYLVSFLTGADGLGSTFMNCHYHLDDRVVRAMEEWLTESNSKPTYVLAVTRLDHDCHDPATTIIPERKDNDGP